MDIMALEKRTRDFVADLIVIALMLRGNQLSKEQQNILGDNLMKAVETFLGLPEMESDMQSAIIKSAIVTVKKPKRRS